MGELTSRMVVSSLFGHIALASSVAAFLPLLITTAVYRETSIGPGWAALWCLSDALNLIGICVIGAPLTQKALAFWYTGADLVLLVQILYYGHYDLPWRKPDRASAFVKVHSRRSDTLTGRLARHFAEITPWQSVQLLLFAVAFGVAWWAGFVMLGLHTDRENFKIEIPMGYKPISFWTALAAVLLFTIARVPEFLSGCKRSSRKERPLHSLRDPLFWFLIFENIWNLASIFTLSSHPLYFLAEIPFIIAAALPLLLDCIMLGLVATWRRSYRLAHPEAVQDEDEKEKALALIAEEKEDVRIRGQLQQIQGSLQLDPRHNSPFSRRASAKMHQRVQAATADFHRNETALRVIQDALHERQRQRQRTGGLYSRVVRAAE
ncbi:hypothetical protein JCM10908_001711 [Rhodotorula pacifica]|uniref:uncharacterized protein n=1 Tax=Rhodotorula pacifica TaxID=1495444 RepID=UPI00316DD227